MMIWNGKICRHTFFMQAEIALWYLNLLPKDSCAPIHQRVALNSCSLSLLSHQTYHIQEFLRLKMNDSK